MAEPIPSLVSLRVLASGVAVLKHGGVDLIKAIPNVAGVGVQATAGQMPIITLAIRGPFEYKGPAQIQAVAEVDGVDLIHGFLTSVDPDALEALAAQEMGGFGGPRTGQAFLNVLQAMAKELADD